MKTEKSSIAVNSIQSNNFNVLSVGNMQQLTGGKGHKRGIGDDIIWDIVE